MGSEDWPDDEHIRTDRNIVNRDAILELIAAEKNPDSGSRPSEAVPQEPACISVPVIYPRRAAGISTITCAARDGQDTFARHGLDTRGLCPRGGAIAKTQIRQSLVHSQRLQRPVPSVAHLSMDHNEQTLGCWPWCQMPWRNICEHRLLAFGAAREKGRRHFSKHADGRTYGVPRETSIRRLLNSWVEMKLSDFIVLNRCSPQINGVLPAKRGIRSAELLRHCSEDSHFFLYKDLMSSPRRRTISGWNISLLRYAVVAAIFTMMKDVLNRMYPRAEMERTAWRSTPAVIFRAAPTHHILSHYPASGRDGCWKSQNTLGQESTTSNCRYCTWGAGGSWVPIYNNA